MAIELSLNSERPGEVPEQIQILPAGPYIEARDGRDFTLADPQALVNRMNAAGRDIVIDYEHSTLRGAKKGEKAPAVGWVKSFYLNDDGEVWANVEWNASARRSIQNKEYKYISPGINYTGDEREIFYINSVALTNDPALTMQALCCNDKPEGMLIAELSALYGVNKSAGASALLSAALSREVDSILDEFLGRFTIIRALEDDLRFICGAIDVGRFRGFMENLEHNIEIMSKGRNALLNRQTTLFERNETKNNLTLSGDESEVCQALGVSSESFIKAKRDIKYGR